MKGNALVNDNCLRVAHEMNQMIDYVLDFRFFAFNWGFVIPDMKVVLAHGLWAQNYI